MTFKFIVGNSCIKLSYLIAKRLNQPIFKLICYQKKNKEIVISSSELLMCDEVFILTTINSKYVNDTLLELMLILNFCKNNSNAKLSLSNIAFN